MGNAFGQRRVWGSLAVVRQELADSATEEPRRHAVSGSSNLPRVTAGLAAALESDARRYPEERGEILLEAAHQWKLEGDSGRAAELLAEVIALGGEDGCYGRSERAALRFEQGSAAAGYAELDLLARDPALRDGPCQLVAEMLAAHDDLEGALAWYDRAVARMDEDALGQRRDARHLSLAGTLVLRGRREVRRQLGLPVDATDELASRPPVLAPPPLTVDDLLEGGHRGVPREVRLLVFQRDQRALARERWPDDYADQPGDEEYYPTTERRWRDLAATGVPAITVVRGTVDGLVEFAKRTGGSPADPQTRAAYVDAAHAAVLTIAWPPGRNAACWCGSGRKYKKCCGKPG